MDSSWLIGHSVNDLIPKDSYMGEPIKLTFPTIDNLVERVHSPGIMAKMFKQDFKRAFKQIYIDFCTCCSRKLPGRISGILT